MIQGEETPQRTSRRGAGFHVYHDASALRGASEPAVWAMTTCLRRMQVPLRAHLLTLSELSSPSCTVSDSRTDVAFHRCGGFPTGLVCGDGGATQRSKRLSGFPAKKKCSLFSGSPVGKSSSYHSWQCKHGHVEDEKRKERKKTGYEFLL